MPGPWLVRRRARNSAGAVSGSRWPAPGHSVRWACGMVAASARALSTGTSASSSPHTSSTGQRSAAKRVVVALVHEAHEDVAHHALGGAVVGRAVALTGPFHARRRRADGHGAWPAPPGSRRGATRPARPAGRAAPRSAPGRARARAGPPPGAPPPDRRASGRRRTSPGPAVPTPPRAVGATAAAYSTDPQGSVGAGVAPKPGRSGATVAQRGPAGGAGRGPRGGEVGVGPAPSVERHHDRGPVAPGLAVQRPTGERPQHPGEATPEVRGPRPIPRGATPRRYGRLGAQLHAPRRRLVGAAARSHRGPAAGRDVLGHPAVRPRRGGLGQDDGPGPAGGTANPRRVGPGRALPGGDLHPQGLAGAARPAASGSGSPERSRRGRSTPWPSPSCAATGPTETCALPW